MTPYVQFCLGMPGKIDEIHHQRDVVRRITLGQGDDIGPDTGAMIYGMLGLINSLSGMAFTL